MDRKIILQDTWLEDSEDILSLGAMVLKEKDILSMEKETFLSSVYFCNTDIVQKFVDERIVPDTYDEKFKHLFHREIGRMSFKEFLNKFKGVPTFVKPVKNDKNFSGLVISELEDFTNAGYPLPNLNQDIYYSPPIYILSESRLLIGNGKIYARGVVSGNIDTTYTSRPLFLAEILKAVGNRYLCVDIALILKNNSFVWCVMEINPPWSIDDHQYKNYGIPFPSYFQFCSDACYYIKLMHEINF